jgi:hypothetical protein
MKISLKVKPAVPVSTCYCLPDRPAAEARHQPAAMRPPAIRPYFR